MKIMLKHRFNYWTCSKFADFIRGEKKPYSLQLHEWDEWKDKQKKERPIRYWLSDTLLDKLQDFFYFPYDVYSNVKSYIRNRWIDKTHYLKTGLKPGRYYEFDTRIIHGLFNELVDYVEIELSHLSKWDRTKRYKFKNGRCIEAAYDYFEWANNLTYGKDFGILPDHEDYGKLTDQAIKSRKIQELYEWWTITRPNRPDPYVVSKLSKAFVDEDNIFKRPLSEEQKKAIKNNHDIEESYDNEDTEMLIELINIRNGLWT
jgi:hypothetical protein